MINLAVVLTVQDARDLLDLVQVAYAIRSAQLEGRAEAWLLEPLHRPNLEAEMLAAADLERALVAVLEPFSGLRPSWRRE